MRCGTWKARVDKAQIEEIFVHHPLPWAVDENTNQVNDANGMSVVVETYMDGMWNTEAMGQIIAQAVNTVYGGISEERLKAVPE